MSPFEDATGTTDSKSAMTLDCIEGDAVIVNYGSEDMPVAGDYSGERPTKRVSKHAKARKARKRRG